MKIEKRALLLRAKSVLSLVLALALALLLIPTFKIDPAWAEDGPGSDYVAGTYTVTASVEVPLSKTSYLTPDLVNVDSSSSDYGWRPSATNNATLVVGDNGSLTLTVLLNSTKLSVTDLGIPSSNMTVTSTSTETRTGKNDTTINAITSITVSLLDASGTYTFTSPSFINPGGMTLNNNFTMTVDFSGVTTKSNVTPKATLPTAASLTYNGSEQVGVAAGVGFTVENGSATDAGTYTAKVTLESGYEWSDGSTESTREVEYSITQAKLTAAYAGETIAVDDTPALKVEVTGFLGSDSAESLASSGYVAPTITAPTSITAGASYDLTPAGGNATKNYTFTYVAGTLSVEYGNGVMKPGTYTVTARLYLPASVVPMSRNMYFTCDESATNGVNATPPTVGASDNATLVVSDDGTLTLTVPLNANALGLHGTSTCTNATITNTVTGTKTYTNPNTGAQTTHEAITELTLILANNSGVYNFAVAGFETFMAPMGKDLSAIFPAYASKMFQKLTVDFSSVPGGTDTSQNDKGSETNDDTNAAGETQNADNTDTTTTNTTTTNSSSSTIAAGTYTVDANLYMEKATTGLPMGRCYLSSDEFPPNKAVSSNGTLVVDSQGYATVSVPIVSKVMSLTSLSGFDVASTQTDSAGITNATFSLGKLDSTQSTVLRYGTVSVALSDMVQSMAGLDANQTWAATLEVNLSGLPTSDGGTVSSSLTQTGDNTTQALCAALGAGFLALCVASMGLRRSRHNKGAVALAKAAS